MREIDTDAQVVWPAWCYSGNSEDSTLNGIGRKGDIDSEILPEIEAEEPAEAQNHGKSKSLNSRRHRSRKEPGAPREAVTGEKSNFLQQQKQQHQQQQGVVQSLPSFVLNKFQSSDKMLSDRMVIGFNAVDNNKKHCDNPTTNLFLDKVKNEAQMDSAKNGELGNNNNNNNTANSVSNSSSNNNSIKRERLSPPTNGDVQSSISRSRSATPSSFPGTPPQPTNPNEPPVGQSTLSTVQARASEFQARNYSDFMRSLAAKYNNPSDSNNQRSMLFEAAKFASSKSSVKESPSPPDIKRPNLPNLTPPQAPQVPSNPFVSSLLSSLPFSPAVFPPLIDMSSTQALVTLARAAKEAEIQNILRSAQKRPSTMQRRSPSSRASLTPTPQQSAPQFPVQPFILPTQFHQAQLQARQASPVGSTSAAPSSSDFTTTSPLDLSSNPQPKRMKLEPDRSRSSSPARDPLTSGKLAKSESVGAGGGGGGVGGTEIPTNEPARSLSNTISRHCQAQSEEINSWTVDDVCEFVGSIDICAEYVKNFREQCIDGSGLPLLTEEHLTNSLGMKLGPALKLRSILAKKLGGPCPCVSCTTLSHQSHLTAAAVASVPSSSSSSSSSSSLGPHNQTTSNTASVNQSSSCSNIPRPASADSGS